MDELQNQPVISQETVQASLASQEPIQVLEHVENKKAIWSVIIGLYFDILLVIHFVSAIYPNLLDLIQKNDILMLLLWAPLFGAFVFSLIPLIIFLLIIVRRIKGIREGKENFKWSLLAIVLNAIAFASLFILILSTGKCIPGFICF